MTVQTVVGWGEVCRLTVYGPESRVELAVPAHVPLADLLPTLLGHLGQELAMTGLDHGGWVLQRLGEPPLEEDLGTAALGLCDGDIVHLRPRNDQLPPVDFDDLVDGVATGIAERKDAWRPESTRRLSLAGAMLALAAGALLAPMLGNGALVAAAAGSVAAVLLLAGTAAVRSFGDGTAGGLVATSAIPFAALSGLALPELGRPVAVGGLLAAPGLLAAGVFVAVAALVARLGTGRLRAGMSGVAVAGALVGAAGLLAMLTGPGGRAAAAIMLPVVLLLGYLTPSVAATLVGLRVRPLPANPREFQQDVDPVPAGPLMARAAVADAHITAIYVALAAVCIGLLARLAQLSGRGPALLLLAASVLVLLHSRELVGARQRVAMLAPGVVGPLVLVLVGCQRHPGVLRPVVLVSLLLLGLLACVAAGRLPGRRLLPHWGLAGDIAHWVAAAAIIPLALSVAGVFALARGR